MAINGTEFVNNPWNTTFSPFTDIFDYTIGNGNIFYLFPLIVLAFGIYMKTKEPIYATMFIVGSGGILSMGSFLAGVAELGMLFTVFAAIGLTGIVVEVVMQRRT